MKLTPSFENWFVDERGLQPGSWAAYLAAAAIVGLATLLHLALAPWLVGAEFITYFPAVMLATFLWGGRAGLLSVALSGGCAMLFVMPAGSRHPYSTAFFVVVAMVDVGIISALRAAIAHAGRLNARLQRAQVALETEKQKAEQANLSKSRFLAAASHDLGQPLQSIVLIQERLHQRASEPRLRSLVGNLGVAVTAMSEMLDTLLQVNQLESGVVTPKIRDFPIGDLLDRVAAELRYHAEAKGLDLRLVRCARRVRSDPKLLEQILRNLLSNAVKYTARGKVLVGCRRHGAALRIEVLDTGIGIAADQLEVIFEEFHQLDNPGRDRRLGLGLGLSIVERLSKLLGHRLVVRSNLHQGSCFSVEAPLVRPSRSAPRSEAGERSDSLSLRDLAAR